MVNSLYEGSLSDNFATAIKYCDPEGPIMMYIFKINSAIEKGRFYAFEKLCSDTKVRIIGPDYVVG